MKMKRLIDFLMTLLLLMLMAYQITGERLHEWAGTGMVVLFAIHHFLNIRWYGNLKKGPYKPLRILQIIVNFLLLATMVSLAYSGIVMSRHVFAFLPISRGMALARKMHLAGSYWGFVLMSFHLGLHWRIAAVRFGKLAKGALSPWLLRLASVFIAAYGALCFYRSNIASYLFLQVDFAFLDYEKRAAAIFSEYLAMMGLWVFIAYYLAKALVKWQSASGRAGGSIKSKERQK